MILLAMSLRAFGPFRGDVRLADLSRGLNVLAAPNETGKSTLFGALHHGLLTPFKTKDQALKDLVPWTTDLGPSVDIEFEHGPVRYRLRKTFLRGASCSVSEWLGTRYEPKFEGERADEFVRDLLLGTKPEKGSADSRHAGLARVLWVPQGKGNLEAPVAGPQVASRIQAALGSVVSDPVETAFVAELRRRHGETYTAKTGSEARSSALAIKRAALERLDKELGALREELSDARRLGEDLALESDTLAACEEKVRTLAGDIAALEKHVGEVREIKTTHEIALAELGAAQARLAALAADLGGYQELAGRLGELAALLPRKQDEARAEGQLASELAGKLKAAEDTASEARRGLAAAQAEWDRAQKLRDVRRDLDDRDRLSGLLVRLREAERSVAELQGRLAGIAAVPEGDRETAVSLDDEHKRLQAQIRVAGITVALELDPERTVRFSGSDGEGAVEAGPGAAVELFTLDRLDLALAGVGRILVRSGAGSARELERKAGQAQAALRDLLGRHGAATLGDLDKHISYRKDVAGQLREAEAALRSVAQGAGDAQHALQSLAQGAGHAEAALQSLAQGAGHAQHAPEGPGASPSAWLQARLAGLQDRISTALAELQGSEAQVRDAALPALEHLGASVRAARERADGAWSAVESLRERLSGGQARVLQLAQETAALVSERDLAKAGAEAILARHSGGLPALQKAHADALAGVSAGEARVRDLAAKLPPPGADPEMRLLAKELEAKELAGLARASRDKVKGLEALLDKYSGRGLYDRISALEEDAEQCLAEVSRLDLKGRAVKLLLALAEERQRRQASGVVRPLAERTTDLWASVTGIPGREVAFADDLALRGVGVAGDERGIEAFSGGAREQLFLVSRLALAEVLARDERQCLVVDDTLVHSDPARRDRMLDVLADAARSLQIVILTCDGDRYANLAGARRLALQLPVEA